MIKAIDYDKLNVKLLDMEFPIQDQDPFLDLIDDCMVDAVPDVRCKDCRWYETSRRNYPECILHCEVVELDYFCASGEKE